MRQNHAGRPSPARRVPFVSPLVGIVGGCLRPEVNEPAHYDRGLILMLPGIEGTAWQLRGVVRALREAGVQSAIEIRAWGSHPFCQLYNLCALRANRERAARIAGRIGEYMDRYPGRPVTLFGYSGGGGIAVLTAEALPPERLLDRIVLMSAAVSPSYDPTPIAARTRHGVVNFYSRRDWFFLGMGTSVFGTIDRHRGVSAGRVGFLDPAGRPIEAPGLTQIPWRPEWRDLGHDGGHIGWLSPHWAREVLARVIEPAPAN